MTGKSHNAIIVAHVGRPRPQFDPRRFIATSEITDIALAGVVAAARYTKPITMTCSAPRTVMRSAGSAAAMGVSELLWGENFDLFDVAGGWGFGRSTQDHYTGWVEIAKLREAEAGETHMVTARLAPLFCAPDIKAPVASELPFGARIAGVQNGRFLAINGSGFVHQRHLAPLPRTPLAIARRFTGAPYLWGGRTPLGVDCSGLVQVALTACGTPSPRDSDQQRDELGTPVDFADRRGGDLIFFPGHVGILVDADTLFHANAYWMTTVEEPLDDVIARMDADGSGGGVTGVRRI